MATIKGVWILNSDLKHIKDYGEDFSVGQINGIIGDVRFDRIIIRDNSYPWTTTRLHFTTEANETKAEDCTTVAIYSTAYTPEGSTTARYGVEYFYVKILDKTYESGITGDTDYQIINFGFEEQTTTDCFYAWLTDNATQFPAVGYQDIVGTWVFKHQVSQPQFPEGQSLIFCSGSLYPHIFASVVVNGYGAHVKCPANGTPTARAAFKYADGYLGYVCEGWDWTSAATCSYPPIPLSSFSDTRFIFYEVPHSDSQYLVVNAAFFAWLRENATHSTSKTLITHDNTTVETVNKQPVTLVCKDKGMKTDVVMSMRELDRGLVGFWLVNYEVPYDDVSASDDFIKALNCTGRFRPFWLSGNTLRSEDSRLSCIGMSSRMLTAKPSTGDAQLQFTPTGVISYVGGSQYTLPATWAKEKEYYTIIIDSCDTSQEYYDYWLEWLTANATKVLTLPASEEAPKTLVTYNGETIASLEDGQTVTLVCAGKKMRADVVITSEITTNFILADGSMLITSDGLIFETQ